MEFSWNIMMFFVSVCLYSRRVDCNIKIGGTDGAQKMTFKAPELTEEDTQSLFVPEELKCDACNAVAYQLYHHFDDFNKAHKHYKYKLPESEILDLFDNVCGNKGEAFSPYGIKEVKGRKRINGPGMEAQDFPGIISGGGKWPYRLVRTCANFLEDLGEEEIYEVYRKDPHNEKVLYKLLCKGTGVFGSCKDVKTQMRVLEL